MNISQIIVTTSLIVAATANIIIGSIVYFGKQNSRIHQSFGFFTAAIFGWIVTNALYGIVDPGLRYPIALLSYACALLIAASMLLFSIYFTATRISTIAKLLLGIFGGATAMLSTLPGFIATGVTDDLRIVTNMIPLSMYALVLIVYFGASLWILVAARRKYYGVDRQRINFVLAGLVGAILLGTFFNLVLPYIGDYRYVQMGPVASLLLVSATAYAIVRHGLFDIRAVVARILSYVLALLMVAVLYVLVVFNLLGFFFPVSAVSSGNAAFYTFFAVITALTFQPVKKFFDTMTDKLFYRREYVPAEVLADFGDIVATEINPKRLVKSVIDELFQTIKPEYVSVQIKASSRQGERVFFVGRQQVTLSSQLQKKLVSYPHKVIITDYVGGEHENLREALRREEIAMLVILRTSHERIGYLAFGPKRNGNIYNSRDKQLFSTIGNELALGIQNSLRFEEIQEFNQTLQSKVDDATERLRHTNRKLRQLDATKDEFVSMASHQLRTPLTSVKGYISMVLEGDAGKLTKMQRQLLGEAFTSSERMVHLISDFLNVSRLQTGKFLIETRQIDLSKVVAQEVESLQTTAKAHNMKLLYRMPSHFPLLYIDEAKIRQVIMNFIDNAIYYSKEHTVITVKVYLEGPDVVVTVHDTGIGVPKAEQAHLFTKFFRASNARKQRPDGTGVGLFLAKKVVTAHGGSMIFESRQGEGSTFGFRLPVKRLSNAPANDAEKLDK